MTEAALLRLKERAPIYQWLAKFFVCEIDSEAWKTLQVDGIRETLIRIEPSLEADLSSAPNNERLESLCEEFARLFLLPGGVSPFASGWAKAAQAESQTRDEIAQLVEQGLLALGRESLQPAPWGRLQRDHIAVILDLVSAAGTSDDPKDQELGAHLEAELLAPCLAQIGQGLADRAQDPVYVALGRLIASLPLE